LAKEAHAKPELLRPELPWLVTENAKNGFLFGHALSRLDATAQLLPELLTAQQAAVDKPTRFF